MFLVSDPSLQPLNVTNLKSVLKVPSSLFQCNIYSYLTLDIPLAHLQYHIIVMYVYLALIPLLLFLWDRMWSDWPGSSWLSCFSLLNADIFWLVPLCSVLNMFLVYYLVRRKFTCLWWYTLIILVLEGKCLKDLLFWAKLGYIMNSSSAWGI